MKVSGVARVYELATGRPVECRFIEHVVAPTKDGGCFVHGRGDRVLDNGVDKIIGPILADKSAVGAINRPLRSGLIC